MPQPDSPTIARNSPRARSKSTPSTATTREEARRVAVRIAPVAAVADVGLFVLGGGIGADADLLLEPIRPLLAEWLPYPPRVEVSSLGEAAVLMSALAHGPRAALDSVFAKSRCGVTAARDPVARRA